MKKTLYSFALITILLPSIKSIGQEFYGTVKVDSNLWVDATEITNNEYRQFTDYVRDSIARNLLFKNGLTEYGTLTTNSNSATKSLILKWEAPIIWCDSIQYEILDELYFSEEERFYPRKSIDPINLKYTYFDNTNLKEISVYPDTTCWTMPDSTIQIDQLRNMYFWHPAFDDYPVVGVNFEQAKAFCHWRTNLYNRYNSSEEKDASNLKLKFELPTFKQWNNLAGLGNLGGKYAGTITSPFKPTTKEEIKHLKKHEYLVNTKETSPIKADDEYVMMATLNTEKTFGMIVNNDKKTRIYGLSGNVAEMTLDKNVTGGSWIHSVEKCIIGSTINHDVNIASPWMGFRCVVSIEK
jgi:formylglycine-generating enzyme required for sulfatase activity